MKISIIIPVYNSELYLKKCLDSIIGQDYQNLEILVINDGSTDKSKNIILEYAKKDKRIIYIEKENSGVSDSRNIGIKKASGNYITFVDADDWVDSDYISSMYKIIDEKKVSCAKTNFSINFSINKEKINDYSLKGKINLKNMSMKRDFYLRILTGDIQAYVTTVLFDRKVLINNNIYFDKKISMMEDTLFYLQYFNYIDTLYIDTSPKYHYYYNLNSASHSYRNASRNIDDLIKINILQTEILKNNKINIEPIDFYFFNYKMIDNFLYDLFRYDKKIFKEKCKKIVRKQEFNNCFEHIDFNKMKIYNKLSLKILYKNKYTSLYILYFCRQLFSKIKKK